MPRSSCSSLKMFTQRRRRGHPFAHREAQAVRLSGAVVRVLARGSPPSPSANGVRCSAANTSSCGGYTVVRARSAATNCWSSAQYGLANSARSTGFQSVRSARLVRSRRTVADERTGLGRTGVRSVTPRAVGCAPWPERRRTYRCQECGAHEPKWAGRCSACEAWGSLVEEAGRRRAARQPRSVPPARCRCPIAEVDAAAWAPARHPRRRARPRAPGRAGARARSPCSAASPASASPPCCSRRWPGLAKAGQRCLYVTAEESAQQVRLRAERLGALPPHLWLVSDTALPHVLAHIDAGGARRRRHRLDPDGVRPGPQLGARLGGAGARVRPSLGAGVEGPRDELGARRPRHQGGLAGRSTRARAPGRHRPVVRGRAAPRAAPAPRREAPLRRHRRARALRDDRRAGSRACPTRRRCSSPIAGRARPARWSRPCSTGTARCSSRCRRSSRASTLPAPRRSAQGLDSGRLALVVAVLQQHVRPALREARRAHRRGRRRDARSSRAPTSRWRSALASAHQGVPVPARRRGVRRGGSRRRAAPGPPDAAPAGGGGRASGSGARWCRRARRSSSPTSTCSACARSRRPCGSSAPTTCATAGVVLTVLGRHTTDDR